MKINATIMTNDKSSNKMEFRFNIDGLNTKATVKHGNNFADMCKGLYENTSKERQSLSRQIRKFGVLNNKKLNWTFVKTEAQEFYIITNGEEKIAYLLIKIGQFKIFETSIDNACTSSKGQNFKVSFNTAAELSQAVRKTTEQIVVELKEENAVLKARLEAAQEQIKMLLKAQGISPSEAELNSMSF